MRTLEICVLKDSARFLTTPGLAWQAALKKTNVKLGLLTDIDMLLMVEKDVRGGICRSIYWYAKANNKYMKNYDKYKESSYLNYWYVFFSIIHIHMYSLNNYINTYKMEIKSIKYGTHRNISRCKIV